MMANSNTRERLEEIKEKIKDLPIWKLIIFISNKEKELIALKKQGESYKSKGFKKRKRIRNAYREVLLEKLIKWKENPDSVDDSIDYASVTEVTKDEVY